MTRRPKLAVTALAAALLASGLASAEIHKWVDEKGVTHFSDTPPPTQTTQRVNVQPSGGNAAEAKPAPEAAKSAQADAKPAPSKDRAERCKNARDALARLNDPEPIAIVGKDGEKTIVPDADRPKHIEQVKKVISQQCDA